jgi:hypothetical protein
VKVCSWGRVLEGPLKATTVFVLTVTNVWGPGAGACSGDGAAGGGAAPCSRRTLLWTPTGTRQSATTSGTVYNNATFLLWQMYS